ncbi:hypothetical protein Tco_0843166 [Tanacetum coccineum]|uniref:Uncharacterized protein n=1 Tax=Tanacetum coccineum TaxID=301880 RepID=A0ABQ5B325_9ASTR
MRAVPLVSQLDGLQELRRVRKTASSKSVKECSLNSETKDVHAIKYKMSKAKERCMTYFRSLHSHLQVLSKEDLIGTRIEYGFKRAFMSLFGQDHDTFTRSLLLKEHVIKDSKKRRVNKRHMQTQESKIDTGKALDADLVDTESIRTDSTVQDDNNRSRNDTYADDANIKPIYDEEPMAEIKKEINVLETMNIELEHSVAKLRKENETLKQHYKDFSDSGKGFCNCCFKNDLRKLKGNSVDTKFDKTSVLGKPVLPSLRNQSVVRQPNAFKSERPQMSKQRFASQVDVNNNFSRPVTQYYLPKKTESAFAKPDHMIASSSSRNSSKNMPRFSLNDMVHNHYLDEARKKTQERDRNSKTSMMPSARFQCTTDDSKPKPRSNNQTSRSLPVSKSSRVTITVVPKADHSKSSSSFSDSKQFVCSTCHKCVFNANHDACITKLLKEVNSRAKIQSHKTKNSNKPVDQKSHTQKPGRQIFTRDRFSPNKTSVVYEKTSPRSDLRWKPTGRIFKTVGLRWIPTGKLFNSCTSKVDSEPPHGSNVDILNIHVCKQTLDLGAGTSLNGQKQQRIDLSAGALYNVKQENLRVWLLKKLISQKPLSKWIHK